MYRKRKKTKRLACEEVWSRRTTCVATSLDKVPADDSQKHRKKSPAYKIVGDEGDQTYLHVPGTQST